MKRFLLSFFLGTALTAGPITTIDVPGATLINLEGISNNGVAVGYYFDGTKGHGFEVLEDLEKAINRCDQAAEMILDLAVKQS